jgi:hypothetical protein
MAKTKITKKDFRLFAKEIKRWLKILDLAGWEIYYLHMDMDTDELATVSWDLPARSATFALGTEWRGHPKTDDEEICDISKHEALHLFLARITSLAETRYVAKTDIDEEVHNLIAVLQGIVHK